LLLLLISLDPFLVVNAATKGGSAGLTHQMNTMTMGHQQAQSSGPVYILFFCFLCDYN
jgi:hypothetical protein